MECAVPGNFNMTLTPTTLCADNHDVPTGAVLEDLGWSITSSSDEDVELDEVTNRLVFPVPDQGGMQTIGDLQFKDSDNIQTAGSIININTPASAGQDQRPFILFLQTAPGDGAKQVAPNIDLKPNGNLALSTALSESEKGTASAGAAAVESGPSGQNSAVEAGGQESRGLWIPSIRAAVHKLRARRYRLWALAGMLCLLVLAVGFALLLSTRTTRHQPTDGLMLVRRSEWGARHPKNETVLSTPVTTVTVEDTSSHSHDNKEMNKRFVKTRQRVQMDRNYTDISYNFLVGADGRSYEGRGWDVEPSYEDGGIIGSLAVALIGNFKTQTPILAQMCALKLLLQWGVNLGKVHPEYRLHSKCHFVYKKCSGLDFLEDLKNVCSTSAT